MSKTEVNGLKELGEALKEFGGTVAKRYLTRATFKAALVFKEAAIQKAPVRSGAMRDAIAIFRRRAADANTARYLVGVRKIRYSRKEKQALRVLRGANQRAQVIGDAYYWRFVEFKTSRNKGGHPFLRPAFEEKKQAALETFKSSLADGVEKAAKSARR